VKWNVKRNENWRTNSSSALPLSSGCEEGTRTAKNAWQWFLNGLFRNKWTENNRKEPTNHELKRRRMRTEEWDRQTDRRTCREMHSSDLGGVSVAVQVVLVITLMTQRHITVQNEHVRSCHHCNLRLPLQQSGAYTARLELSDHQSNDSNRFIQCSVILVRGASWRRLHTGKLFSRRLHKNN